MTGLRLPGSSENEESVRRTVATCLGRAIEGIDWIPAGLGCRRFARVHLDDEGAPKTLIARIEAPEDPAARPAGFPPEPPLEPLRALLEDRGLPVPRCFGHDAEGHVELLEDLGSVSLEHTAPRASVSERRALYVEACDLVPRLQVIRKATGVEAFRRRFEAAHFTYKANLFIEWSLASRGHPATASEREIVHNAFARVAEIARKAPTRLAHRDFQSANLLIANKRASGGLVMIDLQGALLAPPEYDLVCLLRDSYVELSADELDFHLERMRARLPDAPTPDTFGERFDLLTLTRKGKDHARFLSAGKNGDERFLARLPATARYLQRAAKRAAERDPRFNAFAELVSTLPYALSVFKPEPFKPEPSNSEPPCEG